MNRGPTAEIDLSAVQHNLDIVRQKVDGRTVIAVVKADAYGHGAVEISRRLVSKGVSHLAVAYTEEAKMLRGAGIHARVLVLFDRSNVADYFLYDLTPVIYDMDTAILFSAEARKRNRKIRVYLEIDTGMGRTGFIPDIAESTVADILKMEGIEIEGLLSQFSEADSDNGSTSAEQVEIFTRLRAAIEEKTGSKLIAHMANSAAVLSFPEGLMDAVRPGLVLYGASPFQTDFGLRPVMKIKSNILLVRRLPSGTPVSYGRAFVTKRDSKIAAVPVGYADGYNRLFSNNSRMLVRGKEAPVAGRICMDMTMIDVTDIEGVSEGDEVVLLGRQGDDTITAAELASRINTIPYEIFTSFGGRAIKEYLS